MKKILRFPVIFIFYSLLFIQNIFSQEIRDVSFELVGEQIYIHYTLNAPISSEFEIQTLLKRLNNASFVYEPQILSGDIGDNQYSGVNKRIIWSVSEDEMNMLDGDDFYFEVIAEEIEASSGGGIPWYYYVGTAAVGGAVAAVLLSGGSDDNNDTTTNTFPSPPSRPQ